MFVRFLVYTLVGFEDKNYLVKNTDRHIDGKLSVIGFTLT